MAMCLAISAAAMIQHQHFGPSRSGWPCRSDEPIRPLIRELRSGATLEIFPEPGERIAPGLLGGSLVIAGRRIVVEAVVGALVDMALVRHVRGGELLVEGRPARRDARVEFAILRIDRGLDLGGVLGARLAAIER